jgi:hypothetical protein
MQHCGAVLPMGSRRTESAGGSGEASVGQRAPTNTQVVLAPGGDESCTHCRCREHLAVSVMRRPRRRNVQCQKTSHSAGLSHRVVLDLEVWTTITTTR